MAKKPVTVRTSARFPGYTSVEIPEMLHTVAKYLEENGRPAVIAIVIERNRKRNAEDHPTFQATVDFKQVESGEPEKRSTSSCNKQRILDGDRSSLGCSYCGEGPCALGISLAYDPDTGTTFAKKRTKRSS